MTTTNGRINAKELKGMLDRGDRVLVLNVLPERQYAKEHIPGSENVPQEASDFERQVESLAGSKTRDIVVHCSSPSCKTSVQAEQALTQAGFTNVRHFPGGMESWKQQGYPVETGAMAAGSAGR